MGHYDVGSGHLTFSSFLRVDSWSMDPWVLGHHNFGMPCHWTFNVVASSPILLF